MLNNFYVYLYTDVDGIPIYVGNGKNKRAWKHYCTRTNTYLNNVLQKRIRDGICLVPTFLCKNADEEFAFFVEEEAISKFGRLDLKTGTLFNLSNGGEGNSGHIRTQQRDHQSNVLRGRPLTPEHRRNISKAKTGIPRSKSTKLLISVNHGRKVGCVINGQTFDSVKQASEQTGIATNTIWGRIRSKNFPEYVKK